MKTQPNNNETPYLENILQTAASINTIDYNKMLSDFELESRHENHLKKIRLRWANEGKKYNKRINDIKYNREQEYKEKNGELMAKLNKKEQLLLTALSEKRQAKSEEKQRIIRELIEKEDEARRKVEEYHYFQEEQRLKEAQRTKLKIASFLQHNQLKKKETHERIAFNNTQNEQRFSKNYEAMLEKNAEVQKIKEEQGFKKYESFYWHKRELIKKQKERKIKIKNKLEQKEERLRELEVQNNEKRKEINKRLNMITTKKENYERIKLGEFEKEKEKRESIYQRTLENKKALKADRDTLREEILQFQGCILNRAFNKENITDLKRLNAHEETIVEQMTLEKNLASFRKRMDRIKSDSIIKMTIEERKALFKEIKRKEAEKKKKDDEEKQNK